ncbi:MAG TPA: histidine phosphatase family protein [Chloroflexia bacterium]
MDQHQDPNEQAKQQQPGRQTNTVLICVRHTDVHNPEDLFYGRLPRFGLSVVGRQQAERTATILADVPVDAFYTSPMLRARQTARVLASRHKEVPVRLSRLLIEVYTSWQGRSHAELEPLHFDFYSNPLDEADETLDQIWDRINRFVRRVRRRHPCQTIVGVTHGDVVFLAKSGFRGMPIAIESIRRRDFYPGKGSLTRLTFSNDLSQVFPLRVEYYDPNSEDPQWNQGWVTLEPVSDKARLAARLATQDVVV